MRSIHEVKCEVMVWVNEKLAWSSSVAQYLFWYCTAAVTHDMHPRWSIVGGHMQGGR
jgi:hypothetical protein